MLDFNTNATPTCPSSPSLKSHHNMIYSSHQLSQFDKKHPNMKVSVDHTSTAFLLLLLFTLSSGSHHTNTKGSAGGIPGAPPGGFFGPGGGFGIPGFGSGWGGSGGGGGYGSGFGGPSGGYSKGGTVRPTVVCKEKGPCYMKKLRCPAKCFTSFHRSGKGYGEGGGGGGCTIDCNTKCTAYC